MGLPNSEAQFCEDFLSERRRTLNDLIRKNKDAFPKVSTVLWDNF